MCTAFRRVCVSLRVSLEIMTDYSAWALSREVQTLSYAHTLKLLVTVGAIYCLERLGSKFIL